MLFVPRGERPDACRGCEEPAVPCMRRVATGLYDETPFGRAGRLASRASRITCRRPSPGICGRPAPLFFLFFFISGSSSLISRAFLSSSPYPHSPICTSRAYHAGKMSNTRYSAERAAGREHVPNYPKGFIAIRIVQLILAVVILGLCAYSLTVLAFSGNCLTIFTVSS